MQCNWLSDPVYNHVRLSIPRREDSTTSTCGPARAGRRTPVSRASNRPPIHIQWHRSTRTRRPKTLPSTPHRPAVFLSTDAWKSTLSIAQTSPPAPAAPFKSRYRNCRGRDSSAGPAQLRAAAIPINARDLTGPDLEKLLHRNPFLQFFKPIQDDVDAWDRPPLNQFVCTSKNELLLRERMNQIILLPMAGIRSFLTD